MVVASNSLCYMAPADAETCLGNINDSLVPQDIFLFQESI